LVRRDLWARESASGERKRFLKKAARKRIRSLASGKKNATKSAGGG